MFSPGGDISCEGGGGTSWERASFLKVVFCVSIALVLFSG